MFFFLEGKVSRTFFLSLSFGLFLFCISFFGRFISDSIYSELSMHVSQFTGKIYTKYRVNELKHVCQSWPDALLIVRRRGQRTADRSLCDTKPGGDGACYDICFVLCFFIFFIFFPGITYTSDIENLIQSVLQTNPRGCVYAKIAL